MKKLFCAGLISISLLCGTASAQVCGGGHHGGGPTAGPRGPSVFVPHKGDKVAHNRGAIVRGGYTLGGKVSSKRTKQLTAAELKALFKTLRAYLDSKNLPSGWLNELEKANDLEVKFGLPKGRDVSGLYYPAWNDIVLDSKVDPANLTDRQKRDIVHEMWHAWYDQVPNVTELWLSDAEDEAVGHMLDELMQNGSISTALTGAGAGATKEKGTEQEGINAMIKVDKAMIARGHGSFFGNGYKNAQDKGKMKLLKKFAKNPDVKSAIVDVETHVTNVTAPPKVGNSSGGIAPVR